MTLQLFALDTVGDVFGERAPSFLLLEGELDIRLDLELVLRRRFPTATIKRLSGKAYPSPKCLLRLLESQYDLIVFSLPVQAEAYAKVIETFTTHNHTAKPLIFTLVPDEHEGEEWIKFGADAYIPFEANSTHFAVLLDTVLEVKRCLLEAPIVEQHWHPIEVLHNSENSCVYLVKNESYETAVIKRFKLNSFALEQEHFQGFKQAINQLQQGEYKDLVNIRDVYAAEDGLYYVMEYVQGQTLKDYLQEDQLPVLEQRLAWFKSIVNAIGHLHGLGLLHRDLKSSNIMIRDNGQPVLLDFGLEHQTLLDSGFLRSDEIYCTPYYVSPERILGDPVEEFSDIYALGVLFYEVLTGYKPFDGDSLTYVLKSHLLAPVPELPKDVQHYQPLLQKMMAKFPEERLQSAQQVLKQLEQLH